MEEVLYKPIPKIGNSTRKVNKRSKLYPKFGGTQEIARRKSQIEKGVIQASKPFAPRIYNFEIQKRS